MSNQKIACAIAQELRLFATVEIDAEVLRNSPEVARQSLPDLRDWSWL